MDKFKIGDKVRAIKAFDGRQPTGLGTIKYFYSSGAGFTVEFLDWKSPATGRNTWCYKTASADKYLEHVLDGAAPKRTGKFMPGDRVVRTNCNNGEHAQVGQEATVVFFELSRNMVYVTYPGHCNEKHGGEGWVAYNTKLLDSPSNSGYTFKAGDCGITEEGKSYKVTENNGKLLNVEIDGVMHMAHCYISGKCYGDGRSYRENLLPPTSTSTANPQEFKPGDRVRVTRTAATHENGWQNSWVSSMNDAVGKEFEVASTNTGGVYFKNRSEGFPPFVLELVKAETTSHTTNQKTEDTYMLKIEDRVYINGTNAKDYGDDDLIRTISETEKEIARLQAIGTKSAKIDARIAELEANAKRLATILDDRA